MIERITTSDSKGVKLADKIKKISKRMTQGKGNPFYNTRKFEEESLRQLLLSRLEMACFERPLLIKKKVVPATDEPSPVEATAATPAVWPPPVEATAREDLKLRELIQAKEWAPSTPAQPNDSRTAPSPDSVLYPRRTGRNEQGLRDPPGDYGLLCSINISKKLQKLQGGQGS